MANFTQVSSIYLRRMFRVQEDLRFVELCHQSGAQDEIVA